MNDTASAAPTYDQIVAAWNAQADDYNQWDELGEDEKIEWAVECVHAAVAQGEPLAWMDDGTLRAGSEATAYRVVTDATKRGMTASLAASFITPLYAHPAAPAAQGDAEDAARYRFLAGHCRSTSEHWGGRWSIIVDGPAPKSHDSEDDFDAAIDAARSQAKEGA